MDPRIRSTLAELNRDFMPGLPGTSHARQNWPPGFRHIVPYLRPAFNVLDLGCGNGRLLQFLAQGDWQGHYVGLDSSRELLAIAARSAEALPGIGAEFVLADLLSDRWPAQVAGPAPEAIASLAVLHHIPGASARAGFIAGAAALLRPGGFLILSTWQFLTAPRLAGHILPWAVAGLSKEEVEPEDYLLTWGHGAAGRRYCAFIDEDNLLGLARVAGLQTVEIIHADGLEGNLNLYGVFRRLQR